MLAVDTSLIHMEGVKEVERKVDRSEEEEDSNCHVEAKNLERETTSIT